MKQVELYHPAFWTDHGHWDYINQTPQRSGVWGNMRYRINEPGRKDADFVVVHEDLSKAGNFFVREGCLVLVTGEERTVLNYNTDFLDQFDVIITSRDDIAHHNVVRAHYLHPWWVRKTYDELKDMSVPPKSGNLSAVVSSLAVSESHQRRFRFMTQLKAHYQDKLHWYAKGTATELANKWDGLAPYRYSVAIENGSFPNYFTEKISDCFLAFAMPVYWGCPNIGEYFDDRSFLSLPIDDVAAAVRLIDSAMRDNLADARIDHIAESRRLILEKYHFIAALSDALARLSPGGRTVLKRRVFPQYHFKGGHLRRLVRSSLHLLKGK